MANNTITFVAERFPSGGPPPRPIAISLPRSPHALIIGPTGSGKSVASMLLTAKISFHVKDSKVWILDYKGDDSFSFLRGVPGARYFQYMDCMSGLEEYFSLFQERLSGNPNRSFRLLWCDEWQSLILNLPKKEAEEAKSMLSTVLTMGRSMGCQVLTSTQQASASLFAQGSGTREQYSVILALGNIGRESASMLGLERETMLPCTTIGSGHLLLNSAEQKPVQVPLIGPRGMARMKEDILRAVTR